MQKAGISIAKALRVERGDVVSFVGAGGKTTAMFRLAGELSAAGMRVIATTTTHITKAQAQLAPASVGINELESLAAKLDQYGHCLVVGARAPEDRVFGASEKLIAELSARADVDAILVEADGSRWFPFKAPAAHEPAVPAKTNILVPVAGIDAIGLPLDKDHVHRFEVAARIAQVPAGSAITAEVIARVLSHPEGGAKQRPPEARLVPLLNKADTGSAVLEARAAAEKLLADPSVDAVSISCMQQDPPVIETWEAAAGIVLAAGTAMRYGIPKQLLPWNGRTLVAHSAQVALEAGLNPVIVVLGHEAAKVEEALAGLDVRPVFNPDFTKGQSTSIRKGLGALPSRTGAAVFLLADQPLVEPGLIRTIVHTHRRTLAPACVPVFEGKR
jgi:molybdenum cofactor cytidylyltransferase